MTDTDRQISIRRRDVLRTIGGVTAGFSGLALGSEPTRAASGSYTRHSYDGLTYTKFVPDSVSDTTAVALLVLLHGCTQTADDLKTGTRMNAVAAANDFVVIYPEQSTSRQYNRCWQWFNDENTTRNNGEIATIVGMVEEVKAAHPIDDDLVFAAGMSAGGGMVPNLVVEYGDVFAGVAIHSGFEYDVVESQLAGTLAMSQCNGKDPQQAGTEAFDQLSSLGVADVLPTIVFHGTDDSTVAPCNGAQAVEQALQTNDLLDSGSDDGSVGEPPDEQTTDCSNPHCAEVSRYTDSTGTTVVEHWVVDGMGHAWSGGDAAGSYTDPAGPAASEIVWDFFERAQSGAGGDGDGGEPANEPPTADIAVDSSTVTTDELVSFDGTASSDSDGSIQAFEWTFPDGTTASGATVTHSFTETGAWSVTLSVTDDDGATATDSVTITVDPGETSGYCGVASNYEHVAADRAYAANGYAYAVGSDEQLGLYNTYYTTRLQETSTGYFEIVDTC